MIVAIDNGIDGGLCAISNSGDVVKYAAMPTMERKDKNEVDIVRVQDWVRQLQGDPILVIEEPLKHAKSSQSMRSMSISFGRLIALAELCAYPHYAIEVGEWQKSMLGRIPKGATKKRALELARSLNPSETWLATSRSRVPHDGIVDAFLIARHYLKTHIQ